MVADPNDGAAPIAKGDTIRFTCPCGKTIVVKAEHGGKKVKCGSCQRVSMVPTGNTIDISLSESAVSKDPQQQTLDETPRSENDLVSFLAAAQSSDEIGRLGPYRVLKVLGAGGMGVVFKAEDPDLKRFVALKAMLPSAMRSAAAKERFLREARAAAALKHDHIVSIYQVAEDRGVPYLAMEFLNGESLDDRLTREGRLPVSEAVRIGIEIADGLAAAHECGLVHRDIKPGNIWLESRTTRRTDSASASALRSGPRAKILDFGLARPDDDTHLTRTGTIIGTPAYMSVEQARGRKVDGRSDLYSLGVVLYRALTGELPYKGFDTVSMLTALAVDTPIASSALNPDIPWKLNALIMALLSKDASDRPADAHVVMAALEAIAAAPAKEISLKSRRRSIGRWPLIAGGVTGLVLLLIGAAMYRWTWPDKKLATMEAPPTAETRDTNPAQNDRAVPLPKADEKGEPPAKSPASPKPGEETTNSIGMTCVFIPPGRFLMGSPSELKGRGGDELQHEVELTKGYWLGKHEVTQDEYERIMGANPSYFRGSKLPVENVSWIEAKEFCRKLSKIEGKAYSLPTEAEWEYACRAGSTGPFATGNTLTTMQANYNGKGSFGGKATNVGRGKTTEVGRFPPNAFGICDMHGNVWELTEDWYGPYEANGIAVDPQGPPDGSRRVARGGSWQAHDSFCRSATREGVDPKSRDRVRGFRVAMRTFK